MQQLTNRRLLAIEDVLANDDRAVVIARERFERDGRVLEARCDPGPNANVLVDQRAIEPLSGMAFLNGLPVAVERVSAA